MVGAKTKLGGGLMKITSRRFRSIATCAAMVLIFAFVAAAQKQPAARPLPNDGFPAGPHAQVLSFTASATSIQPSEAVTLQWVVVNADRIEINRGIGIVDARGSRVVHPQVTTTYTIAALGYGKTGNDKKSVTVTIPGTTPAPADEISSGDILARKSIPQIDGHPDLSGVYIAPYHSIHPIDKITLKPGAEKYYVGPEYTFALGEHCLPRGVPDTIGEPYPIQIVETPKLVVILYEAGEFFRVIPTDGTTHPKDLDPTWMGNSVGHWEGDTLVVDVIGVNDKVSVSDYRHTTAYHAIERFRRTDYDTLQYSATIEDPNVFAKPWTEVGTFTLHPEWQIQEYICDENNHNYDQLFKRYNQ